MNEIGAKTLAYLRGEKDLFVERERVAQVRRQLGASGLAFWMGETQKRRVKRFWEVVSLLQGDSRMTLLEMSRRLNVPVSTLFDTLKEVHNFFHFTIVLKDFPVGNACRADESAAQEAPKRMRGLLRGRNSFFFTPKALKGDLLIANPNLKLSPFGVG